MKNEKHNDDDVSLVLEIWSHDKAAITKARQPVSMNLRISISESVELNNNTRAQLPKFIILIH